MSDINNKEFWIIWKHRSGKAFDVRSDDAYYLMEKGYLSLSNEPSSDVDKYDCRFKVFVTRDGIRAAELHKDSYFDNRWTSLRAWISLGVAIIALIVSIIALTL